MVVTINAIEQIVLNIENAPQTFINLSVSGGFVEVFGPITTLGKKETVPRYGYSDEVISEVESGVYSRVVEGNIEFCGRIFGVGPMESDGAKALPLMMRLARAGLIAPTNYSETKNLDAWSATRSAGLEMSQLVQMLGNFPSQVKERIKSVLSPDSPMPAGRKLYEMIMENYK